MIKEFNNLEEMERYYNKETETYVFKEDGEYIDVVIFNFDLSIDANIEAHDINAWDIDCFNINAWDIAAGDIKASNIKARDINAEDIKATKIKANNISYYAVCFAYESIKCKSIEGTIKKAKHFVLCGKLKVEKD